MSAARASRSVVGAAFPAFAATVMTIAAAAVTAPPAAALPDACHEVHVVFARGTGEPAGVGTVGQAFVDALTGRIAPRSIGAYGVDYPASYDFALASDGAATASSYIVNYVQSCPSTDIVLGGFSQGAAVVDMLTGVPPLMERLGNVGAPLPAGVSPNIAAVAVFGNPAAKFGNPISSASALYAGRAVDLCKDGDPICSGGRNPFAHSDYVSTGLTNQAADFVAGLV